MVLKQKIRDWLLEHPSVNPYKISTEKLFHPLRLLSAPLRVLPDFAIIGAARCGTTSLYYDLIKHPDVYPGASKASEFFDHYYEKGTNYYRAHFPTRIYKNYIVNIKKNNFITGEATPSYFIEPNLYKRVLETKPDLKLIAILRNPIDRAFSHHNYLVSRNETKFSNFFDAIKYEEKLIEKNEIKTETEQSIENRSYTILRRGMYALPLEILMKNFPNNQIFIIKFEDFSRDPGTIINQIFTFLKLKKIPIKKPSSLNAVTYDNMDPKVRQYLINFFKPYNEKLDKLLDKNFDWNK